MLGSIGFFLFLQRTSQSALQRTHFVHSCGPSLIRKWSIPRNTIHSFSFAHSCLIILSVRCRPFGIAKGYGLDGRVSIPGGGRIFFSQSLDQLWGPRSLLRDGYRGQSGKDVNLATLPHIMPRSRMVELCLQSPIYLLGVMLN
jgi:hypothetical protein